MSLIKEKEEQTKVIINCGVDLKNEFKDICKKNNLKMTDVLRYTIEKIVEKGDIDSVDYRA